MIEYIKMWLAKELVTVGIFVGALFMVGVFTTCGVVADTWRRHAKRSLRR